MKALALLIIAGAFSLHASAFFGVWTAPGLENLPTYAEVVKKQDSEGESEEPESGIFPISDAHQFQPHGVVADWGNAPVIAMPARHTTEEGTRPAALPKMTPAPRRTTARSKSAAPKVAALRASYPWHASDATSPEPKWYERKRTTSSALPWYSTGKTVSTGPNWYAGRQMRTRHRYYGRSGSTTASTQQWGGTRAQSFRAPRF